MRPTLRALGLAATLLAPAPVIAADPELSDKDKLTQILREVQEVKRELADLRTSAALQAQNSTRDVRDLQRRMEDLERSVERMAGSRARVSSSFTPSDPAAAGTATIRVQNRYSVPATVYVNGQPYPVPAYSTRQVAGVPAGVFSYEVVAEGFGVIHPASNRSVGANETYSIFINPPAAQQLLIVPGT